MAFFFSGRLNVSHATPASSSIFCNTVVISTMLHPPSPAQSDYKQCLSKHGHESTHWHFTSPESMDSEEQALKPLRSAKATKEIPVEQPHNSQRHRVAVHPLNFRHVLKIHAIDPGDQSGHGHQRAVSRQSFRHFIFLQG